MSNSGCDRRPAGARPRPRTPHNLHDFALAVTIAGAFSCAPARPSILGQRPLPNASGNLPSWFPGVWTREWIERGGARTDRFDIRFLQTPTLFGDVRIPRDRSDFSHTSSFADLTDAELRSLAKQRGFAGTTSVSGELATWRHEIDFQPPDSSPDIGRLERIDDTHFYEHATDSSYIESWRSLGTGDGKFLALRVERVGRLDRVLLVAGDHFLYVRNRPRDLPVAPSLDSLIVTTQATRAQVIEYLDCELSAGRIHAGSIPWEIQHSTLPWREGRHLDFADDIRVDDSGELQPRAPSPERWSVQLNTFPRAERIALFTSRR